MNYFGSPLASPPIPATAKLEHDLEFYPTPLWATRAFMAWLKHSRGLVAAGDYLGDPCCGQGHMAYVLQEFSNHPVVASDIHPYGFGQASDFLDDGEKPSVDWWIMNPPYGLAERFVEVALEHPAARAAIGVACLVRLGFLESWRRQPLFIRRPPLVAAVCVDRPNLRLGYWEPDGTTRMPYCWVVWLQDRAKLPLHMLPRFERRPELDWIRSGARTLYSKPDDRLLWGGKLLEVPHVRTQPPGAAGSRGSGERLVHPDGGE